MILSVDLWHCHNAKFLLEKWEHRWYSCLFPTTLCPSSKPVWAEVFNFTCAAHGSWRPVLKEDISSCQLTLIFTSTSSSSLSYRDEGWECSSSCQLSLGEGKEMFSNTSNQTCSLSSLQIPSGSELAVSPLNFAPHPPSLEIAFRRQYKEYNLTCQSSTA